MYVLLCGKNLLLDYSQSADTRCIRRKIIFVLCDWQLALCLVYVTDVTMRSTQRDCGFDQPTSSYMIYQV